MINIIKLFAEPSVRRALLAALFTGLAAPTIGRFLVPRRANA